MFLFYTFVTNKRLLRDFGGRGVPSGQWPTSHMWKAKYILWPGMLSIRLCRMGEFVLSNGHFSIHFKRSLFVKLRVKCEGFLWSRFYFGALQFYMVRPL